MSLQLPYSWAEMESRAQMNRAVVFRLAGKCLWKVPYKTNMLLCPQRLFDSENE